MTDWQSRYPTLLATPAEAIAAVRRGRRILIGSGAAEPTTLVRALIDHGDQRPNRGIYPVAEESEIEVDGITLAVRPVRASDEEAIQDLFYRLSDESARYRMLGTKTSFPREEMSRIVDVDYDRRFTLVVTDTSGSSLDLVAVASYAVDPETGLADIDFVVRDDWQGRGIGTALMQRMVAIGKAHGLRGFTATMLTTNSKMLHLFQQSGLTVEATSNSGVCDLTGRFPA